MGMGVSDIFDLLLNTDRESEIEDWIGRYGSRTGAVFGGLAGLSLGFSGGGLGGAILGALMGAGIGALLFILFGFFLVFVVLRFAIVAVPIGAFVLVIYLLWGAGR